MDQMTLKSRWPSLVAFLLLSAAAIGIGQWFPPDEWFQSLQKPSFNPPNWAFPVVWTPLYVMIAIAGWLIWTRKPRSPAMLFWAVQLVLNVAWTWLFFGMHRTDLALLDIVLLWLAIGATIGAARRLSPIAAGLLVPYWAWVSFATALNVAFWRLNG